MLGKTVLVVDDEPHIRHMLEFKFGRAGYAVLSASNGHAAFDLAREHHPDMVVTDYQMPGGDGLELGRRLRSEPATAAIPVVMLTARGYRVPDEDLAQTGIVRLMPKPFSPRALIVLVGELLEGRQTQDEAA